MRHQSNRLPLWIGVFLTAVLAADRSAAQQYPGTGYGNGPLTPVGSTSPQGYQPMVPGPPAQPPTTSRPATWPGGGPADASAWAPPQSQSPPPQTAPAGPMNSCNGARIVAHVGTEVILESDLIVRNPADFLPVGSVDYVLELNKSRIPPDQWDAQRAVLMKNVLAGIIQTKLVYLDAKHTIPSEGWPQIEKQLTKAFDDGLDDGHPPQLKKMMKQLKVDSLRELDLKLHAMGTSLEAERRAFSELLLKEQWKYQQVKRDEEITYDQMVVYYRQHQDAFTTPARARWEELMVRFAKYPDKAAAYNAIVRMGNQVLAGVPLADVARAGSDGVEAPKGGRRDWTTKGSLACDELNRALFGLPIGQMSPIIEGPTGYHILRVTQREEVMVTPFLDAQVAIHDKIVKQRMDKQRDEYLAKVVARTPVKTIFDEDGPNAQLASRPGANPSELRR